MSYFGGIPFPPLFSHLNRKDTQNLGGPNGTCCIIQEPARSCQQSFFLRESVEVKDLWTDGLDWQTDRQCHNLFNLILFLQQTFLIRLEEYAVCVDSRRHFSTPCPMTTCQKLWSWGGILSPKHKPVSRWNPDAWRASLKSLPAYAFKAEPRLHEMMR